MPILPVRPRPQFGESYNGYLLRIAEVNGWQSRNDILHICGVTRASLRAGTGRSDDMVTELCATLRMSVAQWDAAFPGEQRMFEDQRQIRSLLVDEPLAIPSYELELARPGG